jgi:TonB family protein
MNTSPPVVAIAAGALRATSAPVAAPPRVFVPSNSYRYDSQSPTRKLTGIAVFVSAALHAGVFFGIGPAEKKALPPPEEFLMSLNLEFTEIKELEEEDVIVSDEPIDPVDAGVLVPMLADAPQVPQPTDFVQQLDFASLIEQPNLSATNITVIPEHISRGKLGETLGTIFNLADLDRQPVPVFQPAPVVPPLLKQEGMSATVHIEFIVTAEGRVVNVMAVDSTNHGFNDAAIKGVGKWKFKPGIKNGRKVNTRMAVPIVFNIRGG